MKKFFAVATAFILCAFLGCSGNDKTGAGINQGGVAPTSSATAQDSAPKPASSDPEASGGTTLRASTPYNQQGATVSQNLNAAPFVNHDGSAMTGSADAKAAQLPANRAMGTVDGPMDMPPAGVAPDVNQNSRGIAASPTGRSATGAKVPAPSTLQAPK